MRIAVLISCEVWCWLIPFSSLNGAWFLQLIFDCASCGAWAPEAWKPRFQILANLWKFKNRWNLKTWFLKIVYKRVSLSKIWAIHQNGRWRTILDPDRQPFLNFHGKCFSWKVGIQKFLRLTEVSCLQVIKSKLTIILSAWHASLIHVSCV